MDSGALKSVSEVGRGNRDEERGGVGGDGMGADLLKRYYTHVGNSQTIQFKRRYLVAYRFSKGQD